MSDIELIVRIPRSLYANLSKIQHGSIASKRILDCVRNGTPLPKGCDIQRIIPKRVDVQKWIYTKCPNPNCNCELSTHHGDGYYTIDLKPDFCSVCGQALLWKESEVDNADSN